MKITDDLLIVPGIFLLGLLFGSFATAVSYRVPRGEQFINGRSKCPSCKHVLGFWDLFPIVSWLYLRGKCRYCNITFGESYPIIETCLALMFVAIYFQMGISISSALIAMIATTIIILISIDFEHYIITDGTNLTLLILGGTYQFVNDASWHHFVFGPIAGIGAGLALRWLIKAWKKCEGLGLGDVKFLAAAGIMLDPMSVDSFLFLSGLIGIVTATVWKAQGKGERFPFGPSLSIALLIIIVYPEYGEWWKNIIQTALKLTIL